jgi:hypothetical protein
MTEKELIDEQHGSIIKGIYSSFFQAYTSAKGNQTAEKDAEDIFRRGVLHARHVRDRAKAILP